MPGDYSRFTDDPKKRFAKVLAQQGRVTLDSDLNELADILTRRDRLQAIDVFGRAAVPRATTPDAFQITTAGAPAGDLKIGAGRMYVKGVLAEAFPSDDALTYRKQPFFRSPDPPAINTLPSGRGLVYLDVWEREVTYVEDPSLLEPALGGVDTATRMQTVWQVKIASQRDFPGIDCRTDLDTIFPPSSARLDVTTVLPAEPPDPCLPIESGGFRDVENRHYRVEIHGSSPPKMKFARDPVVSEIEDITAAGAETIIKVKRIGRDSVLRFAQGNCVEVLSDQRELANQPGIIARITKISEAAREITIDAVVSKANEMGTDANGRQRHARLIRWDQKGAGTDPLDPIPAAATEIDDSGIQIKVTGAPRHGDYWMFPARAATNLAGPLVNAPPLGIIHYYAPLAMISGLGTNAPAVDTDCRTLWPPPVTGGDDCECSACVSAEEHNDGTHTIEMAINEAKAKGGGKVCLKPGLYAIRKPIEIRDAQFLKLTGHGWAVLFYVGDNANEPVIHVESCADVTVEGVIVIRRVTGNQPAISIRNCILKTGVYDCVVLLFDPETPRDNPFPQRGVGVRLEGILQEIHIERNVFVSGTGVFGINDPPLAVLGAGINENLIFGLVGVRLSAFAIAANIARNWIAGVQTGLLLGGTTVPGTSIEVEGNRIFTSTLRFEGGLRGIIFQTDRTTFSNNTISGPFGANGREPDGPGASNSGIVAFSSNPEDTIDDCRMIGNRISRMEGYGIAVDSPSRRMLIKQNFISETGGSGIVVTDRAAGSSVTIENNEVHDVALNLSGDGALGYNTGIRIGPLSDAVVAANTISVVGGPVMGQFPSAGIHADAARTVRIHENRIDGVLPFRGLESAAIDVSLPSHLVEITNNFVRVEGRPEPDGNHCYTVRVGRPARRDVRFRVARTKETSARAAVDLKLLLLEFKVVAIDSDPARVLIRTNQLESFGPYFDAFTFGSVFVHGFDGHEVFCTFGGNICTVTFVGGNRIPLDSCARFITQLLVADSNQMFGAFRKAMDIDTDPKRWTIVGNIVEGPIMVLDSAGVKGDLFAHIPPNPSDPSSYYAVVNRRI